MLSPEVVLTPSHVVAQTVLKKYGGLFGIGLELQRRSAPSSPSRLHSRQSSKLLGRHEKPIGAGFTQLFSTETQGNVSFCYSRCVRERPRGQPRTSERFLHFAWHHSSQLSWSHLQQCELPENRIKTVDILHTLLHECILTGRSKVSVDGPEQMHRGLKCNHMSHLKVKSCL